MKKLIQLLIVISVGLFLNSCYYDAYPEYEEIDDGTGGNENVSYSADIVPLWSHCVGCHNGNTPPNLEDNSYANLLSGYVVSGDAENSVLYMSLLGTGGVSLMPPGSSWPQTKINLVKDWINQGAKNN
jgi:hypothetical protein